MFERTFVGLSSWLILLVACGDDGAAPAADGGAEDAAVEAGRDAGHHAGADAAIDGGSACDDVVCESPPGPCFAPIGGCTQGRCEYVPDDQASCNDGDACTQSDRCSAGECVGEAVACQTPPEASCVAADKLRVYDKAGSCSIEGDCAYSYQDLACDNCPACDACELVTCDAPPNECYMEQGTCTDGSCSYSYDNQATCDDGDWCTENDSCKDGACAGTLRKCDDVPAAKCIDENTLRTWSMGSGCVRTSSFWYCDYPSETATCAYGCDAGACKSGDGCDVSWTIRTVASDPALLARYGRYNAMAIDNAEALHVSYTRRFGSGMMYATNKSGVWSHTVVDPASGVGNQNAIALDSKGAAHFSYYDESLHDLKYATNASGSWVAATIVDAGVVGETNDIAVDASDKVHIVYSDNTNGGLQYMTNQSGSWVTTEATSGADWLPSLALDSGGAAHVAYVNGTGELRYATNASGTWVNTTVDVAGDFRWSVALGLDSAGKVHIAYYEHTAHILKYATNSSGSWVTSTLDNMNWIGLEVDMFIDGNDKVHVSYRRDINYHLRYANNVSGSWNVETVYTVGDVRDTSLVVDKQGIAHIVFYDQSGYALRYASNACPPR